MDEVKALCAEAEAAARAEAEALYSDVSGVDTDALVGKIDALETALVEYNALDAAQKAAYAELYTTGTEKGTPRYTYRRTFDSAGNVTEERKYNYKGKPDGLFVYEYAPLSEAIWQG